MKHNIKDLKPHEAIEINNEKEAKYLVKKLKGFVNPYGKPLSTDYIYDRYFTYLFKSGEFEFDVCNKSSKNINIVYPASDFIKKPNKLKKRVKELEDMVTQLDSRAKQLENLWAKDAYKVISVDNEPTQEPEIDFHKKGQLLIHEEANLVVLTDGFYHMDRKIFGGIVVSGNEVHKKGESSKSWASIVFKLYKKDITLSND